MIRFFSHCTLVYSVTLFSSIIRKYLPHAFCYAQLVSVCLTMMSHLKSWSYIIYCIKDSKVEDYLSTVVYIVTVWRNAPLQNSALFLCSICSKVRIKAYTKCTSYAHGLSYKCMWLCTNSENHVHFILNSMCTRAFRIQVIEMTALYLFETVYCKNPQVP